MQSIKSVVTILQYYNQSKRIAAYGFGAKVHPQHQASSCFALTGNMFEPEVQGVHGLLEAYQNAAKTVTYSEPAQLTEMVECVMKRAEGSHINATNQQYHVLVVLTNGEIEDVRNTINTTVRASIQPLSIILVVLNRDNFAKIKALESSAESPLYSEDLDDFADNVHIVEFEDFVQDQQLLSAKTLAKVPNQVVSFFKGQGIDPMPYDGDERRNLTTRLADPDYIDTRPQEYF